MATPKWNKTLSEVLNQPTVSLELVSEKTGNVYQTDVIRQLKVLSTGSVEEKDGKYLYLVVDSKNDLEYKIKVPNRVETSFGKILQFENVRGGALSNGLGWYVADSVAVVQRNA